MELLKPWATAAAERRTAGLKRIVAMLLVLVKKGERRRKGWQTRMYYILHN